MDLFEYRVKLIDMAQAGTKAEPILNRMGLDGWELVQVFDASPTASPIPLFLFKRKRRGPLPS
jgi:hypothetical protein